MTYFKPLYYYYLDLNLPHVEFDVWIRDVPRTEIKYEERWSETIFIGETEITFNVTRPIMRSPSDTYRPYMNLVETQATSPHTSSLCLKVAPDFKSGPLHKYMSKKGFISSIKKAFAPSLLIPVALNRLSSSLTMVGEYSLSRWYSISAPILLADNLDYRWLKNENILKCAKGNSFTGASLFKVMQNVNPSLTRIKR